MAASRSRYVKVEIPVAVSSNLMGGGIVGQSAEWLLVERPAGKPRQRTKAKAKSNHKTVAGKEPTTGMTEVGARG